MAPIPAEQRELLSRLASDLQTGETRLFTQVESTFKWLMATLWASNGGALAACLGAQDFANRLGVLPFALFTIGLVLSIIMGLVNLLYSEKSMVPMTELKNIFMLGATIGEFAESEVEPLMEKMKKSTIFRWPLWGAGFGSLVFFIAGVVSAAIKTW